MIRILNRIVLFISGFTLGNGLLFILIKNDRNLYESIIYHYSDSLTWYYLFYVIPFLIGIVIILILRKKSLPKRLIFIFWIVALTELTIFVGGSILNHQYWGYYQKRPATFKEIQHAKKVISCTLITNIDSSGLKPFFVLKDTTKTLDCLWGRGDPYYGDKERIFMVFQDRDYITGELSNYSDLYNDQIHKPGSSKLNLLTTLIDQSKIVDKGEKGWDTSGQLTGYLTEFATMNDSIYMLAALQGGQVSNDHYPSYEFLFKENGGKTNLIEYQKFYTDIAGFEGFEFANVIPSYSLIITTFGLLLILIIEIFYRLIIKFNKQRPITAHHSP